MIATWRTMGGGGPCAVLAHEATRAEVHVRPDDVVVARFGSGPSAASQAVAWCGRWRRARGRERERLMRGAGL